MDGRMDGCMDAWINGWMDKRMDEWINMHPSIYLLAFVHHTDYQDQESVCVCILPNLLLFDWLQNPGLQQKYFLILFHCRHFPMSPEAFVILNLSVEHTRARMGRNAKIDEYMKLDR